jgi:hypothetical protein
MLRDIVGQRSRHCVLQQSLVGDQAVAIDGLHLSRVKVHRDHADQDQHAKDDVQNGYSRWLW